MFYDDGVGSDVFSGADNGTTLNTRLAFQGVQEMKGSSLSAGFDITIEPEASTLPGFGVPGAGVTPLLFANQANSGDSNFFGDAITLLDSHIWMKGNLGKVSVGTQSMPTDNMAVLADKSLTLWTGVAPMFRGNGFTIQGTTNGATWANFLQCQNTNGLNIGFDCNGIYRTGVRYDTPQFGPFRAALGWANDDIYDIAGWYDGTIGGLNVSLHGGASMNQGLGANSVGGNEAWQFQTQLGVMDPGTGLFGSISYQYEETDNIASGTASEDSDDAYYIKIGIKRDFNSLGPTAFTFDYGSHNDFYGTAGTSAGVVAGVTGSEIERFGFGINQYFGAGFILYGKYEQLDLNVDCSTAACSATYVGADELDTFNLGAVLFF